MSRARRRLLALGLGVALTAVVLWAGNLWARSQGFAAGLLFDDLTPPPEVGFVWLPDQRVESPLGFTIEINNLGLRDARTLTRERPADTLRVLCVGDSFTYGLATPPEDTFVARIEQMLVTRLAERGGSVPWGADRSVSAVQVLNAGVNGWNSCQEAAWMEWVGTGLQPDLVIVGFVMNDVLPHAGMIAPRRFPGRSWMLRWPLYQWLRQEFRNRRLADEEDPRAQELRRIMNQQRGLIETSPSGSPESRRMWDDALACLAKLRRRCTELGVPSALVVFPSLPQMQRALRGQRPEPQVVLADLSERVGFTHVDLLSAWAAAGEAALLESDKSHPSALGHRLTAEGIVAALDRDGLLGPLNEPPVPVPPAADPQGTRR